MGVIFLGATVPKEKVSAHALLYCAWLGEQMREEYLLYISPRAGDYPSGMFPGQSSYAGMQREGADFFLQGMEYLLGLTVEGGPGREEILQACRRGFGPRMHVLAGLASASRRRQEAILERAADELLMIVDGGGYPSADKDAFARGKGKDGGRDARACEHTRVWLLHRDKQSLQDFFAKHCLREEDIFLVCDWEETDPMQPHNIARSYGLPLEKVYGITYEPMLAEAYAKGKIHPFYLLHTKVLKTSRDLSFQRDLHRAFGAIRLREQKRSERRAAA